MTHEEALSVLRDFLGCLVPERASCKTRLGNRRFEAFCRAFEALEARIPKRPYLEYGGWHCKSCGLNVLSDEYFCPVCGQAIDWRDDE